MNRPSEVSDCILLIAAPVEGDTLSDWLQTQGYALQRAPDGATALSLVANTSPDLILLDAQLPDMAGDVICRQLQALEATRNIPILWMYDRSAPQETERGLASGVTDYLSKPFNQAEVLARIGVHLKLKQLQAHIAEQQMQIEYLTQARTTATTALKKLTAEVEHGDAERIASLRASEAMFRYFLSRTIEGYVIVDEGEHILYANAPARLYLGLDSDHTTQPFSMLIARQYHCEPQEVWRAWPKKTFVDGAPLPLYLVRPETRIARTFWLRVTLLDVPAGMSEAAGRIIRLEDITERTTRQDELNKFHAMISHKLRTPLVPLYSGLQYMISSVEKLSREELGVFLREALSGAKRLYTEIEDIVKYLNTPTNLAPPGEGCTVARLVALTHQIAADLKIDALTLFEAENLKNAQTLLLEQNVELIMTEILENSLKFHPTHSPQIVVQLQRGGSQMLNIQVRDDGLTLSPEQLTRMWAPYYQVDKFATGQVAGMGLGLSLVATQIWSTGGACRAFNREDSPGIVVEMELPLES